MKKIIPMFLLSLMLLVGCLPDKFEKYVVVATRYKVGGMCHDSNRKTYYSTIRYVHTVHHTPHRHRYEEPRYTLTLAKDGENIEVTVNPATYARVKVLEVVQYNQKRNSLITAPETY